MLRTSGGSSTACICALALVLSAAETLCFSPMNSLPATKSRGLRLFVAPRSPSPKSLSLLRAQVQDPLKDERGNNIGDTRYTTSYFEDLKPEVEDLPAGVTTEFIVEMAQRLRAEPGMVRDIQSGSIKFKQHFVGREAVEWMIKSKVAKDRRVAVAYGRQMIREAEIVHCTRGHDFKDEEKLYRFVTDKEKRLINPETPFDYFYQLLTRPPIIFSAIGLFLLIANVPYLFK